MPCGCAWAVAAHRAMWMDWEAADERHWAGVGQPLVQPLLQALSQSMSSRQGPAAVTLTLTDSRQHSMTIHDHQRQSHCLQQTSILAQVLRPPVCIVQ